MTSREFTIWLEGYLQGNGDMGLTTMQVRDIINKLAKVEDDKQEKLKQIIIERSSPPINPFKIQEPNKGDDMDFPGKPNEIYM